MANIVPGAIWRPIAIDYSRRPKRRKGRGLIGHIAVSNSQDLRGNPNGNCWHFYLPYEGPAIQQIDLDYVSGASRQGDATCASFESQGGLGAIAEVNRQGWNANQVEWAARILVHLHLTEAVPLQVMPDSRPASRGFGTHRLGIDPYRVSGGESWSENYAKACPGDGRHEQRDDIVRRAQELVAGTGGFLMALSDAQQQVILDAAKRINGRDQQRWITGGPDLASLRVLEQWEEGAWPARSADVGDIIGLIRLVQSGDARVLAEIASASQQEVDRDAANQAALTAQLASVGNGDPSVLAAALTQALGEQLAAKVAVRLTVTAS